MSQMRDACEPVVQNCVSVCRVCRVWKVYLTYELTITQGDVFVKIFNCECAM